MGGKEEGARMDGIRGIFLSSRNDHAAHWTLYLLGSLRGEREVSRARREVDHLRYWSLALNHSDNSYRATHRQSLCLLFAPMDRACKFFFNLDWSFHKPRLIRDFWRRNSGVVGENSRIFRRRNIISGWTVDEGNLTVDVANNVIYYFFLK